MIIHLITLSYLQATREHIEREVARYQSAGGQGVDGIKWRDHHFIEYYSLGSVERTGHLVDDPKSNTYRALRYTVRKSLASFSSATYVFTTHHDIASAAEPYRVRRPSLQRVHRSSRLPLPECVFL